MADSLFLQLSVVMGIVAGVAFLVRFLRQPLLIAYLITGLIIGSSFFDFFEGGEAFFDIFAKFGVAFLLFTVGLSLDVDRIRTIGGAAVLIGATQIIFTVTTGFLLLYFFLGFPFASAGYLAIALTFSSTIIIVKLLSEKKDLDSMYGRYTLALMVVQDIAALFLIIVFTSFSGATPAFEAFLEFLLKIIVLFGLVSFAARFVIRNLLEKVASSSEFLFIFTIAWCFGVASLLYWFGFSLEVGALIAGITLGSSPYQTEIGSRIKPLRDFFLVLFFIILGSQLRGAAVETIFLPSLIISFFVLLGDSFILYHTFRWFRFTRRNSFLASVTAAQVSEFGFVFLLTGKQLGYVRGVDIEIFTLVALLTIVISSYIITYNKEFYKKAAPWFNYFGKDNYKQKEEGSKSYEAWVFGHHRIGWKICQLFAEKKIPFAVVDFNPALVAKLKESGVPAYFGDAGDVEFLQELPLEEARLIVSTIPDYEDQRTLLHYIRSRKNKPISIATSAYFNDIDKLYEAGAHYVVLPHLVGGAWLSHILKTEPWTKQTFADLQREQKEELLSRGRIREI